MDLIWPYRVLTERDLECSIIPLVKSQFPFGTYFQVFLMRRERVFGRVISTFLALKTTLRIGCKLRGSTIRDRNVPADPPI
jgi:hypothetical protein